MEKLRRPFWLKAMIVLIAVLAFLSSLGIVVSESNQSGLVANIRTAIFVLVLIGLLLNSIVVRWATIVVMALVSIGGWGSLVTTASSVMPPYLMSFLGLAIVFVFTVITFGFAFSKSVRLYYREVRKNGSKVA